MQELSPSLTTWHITWGTYGARPHGGNRSTVDKTHNQLGEPFLEENAARERSFRARLKSEPILLSNEQRLFIEETLPTIAVRGGWRLRTCAAGHDHVHVVLDIDSKVHGERVRRLLKRWLRETLSEGWPTSASRSWWAEEGSNLAIRDVKYLNNAFNYVDGQRASGWGIADGAEDGPARWAR